MNLILLTREEVAAASLPSDDPRTAHVRTTLRRRAGDTFDVGLINGPRGRARIESVDAQGLRLSFCWEAPPPPLPSLNVIVGLPRPQTARDILRDATTLGATALHFVLTEKSDRSYARSTLWTTAEWSRHLIAGAQQAFDTRVPTVSHGLGLAEVLRALPSAGGRVALDVYEATVALARAPQLDQSPLTLALGPERGWAEADRTALRGARFTLAHLGNRVLRTETAVVAALTLARARTEKD